MSCRGAAWRRPSGPRADRGIHDPDTGGRYTVKIYSSEKIASEEGEWRHERITLKPDSDRPGYEPIVIERDAADDSFAVVAELLAVLAPPGR